MNCLLAGMIYISVVLVPYFCGDAVLVAMRNSVWCFCLVLIDVLCLNKVYLLCLVLFQYW